MIIDYYYPDDEWEGISRPHIYIRQRGADGVLVEYTIDPNQAIESGPNYVPPHCWIPAATHPKRLSRVEARYPGTRSRGNIESTALDGTKLMRFDVPNPNDLFDIRNELQTFEADVQYVDTLLTNMYSDTKDFPVFEPRIWYFDMEWQPKGCPHEGAITMIAIDDTHAGEPVVFAWAEDRHEKANPISYEAEGGYELYLFSSEGDMLDAFLTHLDECDPDILIAHALMWADLPKLVERLGTDADRLSPIGQVIRPLKKDGYRENAQPVLGRLCYDTALDWTKGSGLEAMWQKSGKGQFRKKSLANIAVELKLTEEFGEQGEKMEADVFTWWVENFDEFVDYCVRDTTLLRRCSEKLKVIPYHLAMQKHCGVSFKSTCNVSNYIRGLISRHTPLKAPSTYHRQREEYKAATVPDTVGGRHEGVAAIDFKSMYPLIIIDANLCPTTKRHNAQFDDGTVRAVGNGTYWAKKPLGILPAVVTGMLDLRAEYKRLAKEATTEEERAQYDMLQLAVKIATNACYGYVSQKKVGGGWIDPDIGATITHYGRECIETLLTESEKKGYKALAGHTDSGYIQIPFDEIESHLEELNKTIQDKYDLPNMEIELEAYFDYWLTADVKNQNFGIIQWPEEKKGHLKVTGFSYKASTVSPITKEIQGKIFDLVGNGADEEEVTAAIRPMALSVLKGERPLEELAPHGRIGKDKYSPSHMPMAVRGAYYYNEHINPKTPFRTGDSVQWVYVKATPEGMPHTNVVGFRNLDEADGFVIDYSTCVEKFIRAKIKRIYKVLDWDIGEASGAALPKKHW